MLLAEMRAGGAELQLETAVEAIERVDDLPGDLLDALHDELGDAVAALDAEGRVQIGVQQRDHDLAAVPGVHRARRVEDGDAVLGGKSRARMDQAHPADGHGDGQPGADQGAGTGIEHGIGAGAQVQPRVAGLGIARQRQIGVQPAHLHPQRGGVVVVLGA